MIKVVYKAIGKINTQEEKIKLPKIQLSNAFLKYYQIHSSEVTLKFGQWTRRFIVNINNKLSDKEIGLPRDTLPFPIPEKMFFDIRVNLDVIHIGPFVAFIAMNKLQHISMSTLEIYKNRFKLHEDSGKFILICASDSIDTSNQTISGYYYHSKGIKKKRWVNAVFPYPDSVFKKIRIPEDINRSLRNVIGNKLFNTNFFNKYELWEACKDENVKQYLPETRLYQSFSDLVEMLSKHETLYMKPIKGLKGIGIFVIRKEDNGILLINNRKEKVLFHTIHQLNLFLDKLLLKKEYLIQQGVPTIYKNKQFDFRLYFQKNYQQDWVCQGIIGRVAQEESIVTNLNHLAHITTGEKTIRIIYKIKDLEAKKVMNDTITACKSLCEILDEKLGHFGDVAIDVIIDHDFRPWILEVNNLYGKKSLHLLQENALLDTIHLTPLEYASSLAGF